MIAQKVVVIDVGIGNILSVVRALEVCGAKVIVTNEPGVVQSADRLLLPGVGAFGDGISALRRHGLDEAVCEYAERHRPLLGICLGMQLLFSQSEEFGIHSGLGLLSGRVIALPCTSPTGARLRIPHMGWSNLIITDAGRTHVSNSIVRNCLDGRSAYFVHSFHAVPHDARSVIAKANYGDHFITAAVQRDLIVGTQFHLEKSGTVGLDMLLSFLTL